MTITAAAVLALATFLAGLYLGHRWERPRCMRRGQRPQAPLSTAPSLCGTLPRRPRGGTALERPTQRGRRDRHPRPAHPLRHTGIAGAAATGRASTAEIVELASLTVESPCSEGALLVAIEVVRGSRSHLQGGSLIQQRFPQGTLARSQRVGTDHGSQFHSAVLRACTMVASWSGWKLPSSQPEPSACSWNLLANP